jgi:hypothetical protein
MGFRKDGVYKIHAQSIGARFLDHTRALMPFTQNSEVLADIVDNFGTRMLYP